MDRMDPSTAAALLCGGRSERLGFPKEMIRVDGEPLVGMLARRLQECFASVVVLSNAPERVRPFVSAPVIPDAFPHAGPLAGIHAGLRHAEEMGAKRCFFLACDMPLAHNGLIARLVQEAERSAEPVVIASAEGREQYVCGVYSVSLLPMVESRLLAGRDGSLFGLLSECGYGLVAFEGEEARCLRDIDRPEDIAILREVYEKVECPDA